MLALKQCVRGLPLATRAMPARAVAMSAVPQNKSMREPLDEPLMTTDSVVEHAAYENFRVPDSPAYKALMNLQMYYTKRINDEEDTYILPPPNREAQEAVWKYPCYALVIGCLCVYAFTHYRITRGKKKREGQVI